MLYDLEVHLQYICLFITCVVLFYSFVLLVISSGTSERVSGLRCRTAVAQAKINLLKSTSRATQVCGAISKELHPTLLEPISSMHLII